MTVKRSCLIKWWDEITLKGEERQASREQKQLSTGFAFFVRVYKVKVFHTHEGPNEGKGPTILSRITYQWIKEHFLTTESKLKH